MERVALIIEPAGQQLECMLNPSCLTLRRQAGVRRRRSVAGWVSGAGLKDDPLLFTGGGWTEFSLDLLFDVSLARSMRSEDVRELTRPFWELAENREASDGYGDPPVVRLVWGKAWNIPGVVLAVAERLEQFTPSGAPRRSWLRMRLRRVDEAVLRGEGGGRGGEAGAGDSLKTLGLSFPPDVLDSIPAHQVRSHEIVGAPGSGPSVGSSDRGAPARATTGRSPVPGSPASPDMARDADAQHGTPPTATRVTPRPEPGGSAGRAWAPARHATAPPTIPPRPPPGDRPGADSTAMAATGGLATAEVGEVATLAEPMAGDPSRLTHDAAPPRDWLADFSERRATASGAHDGPAGGGAPAHDVGPRDGSDRHADADHGAGSGEPPPGDDTASTARPPGGQALIVADCERLDQLAYRYYGDPRLWRLLAAFNDISDPLAPLAGRSLLVPPASILDRLR